MDNVFVFYAASLDFHSQAKLIFSLEFDCCSTMLLSVLGILVCVISTWLEP